MSRLFFKLILFLTGFCIPALAAFKPHTTVSLLSEKETVSPGQSFNVGLFLKMDHGWHTYAKDPGDSGLPTTIEWKLPKGFVQSPQI